MGFDVIAFAIGFPAEMYCKDCQRYTLEVVIPLSQMLIAFPVLIADLKRLLSKLSGLQEPDNDAAPNSLRKRR